MRVLVEFVQERCGRKGDREELKGRRGGDKGNFCDVSAPDGGQGAEYDNEKRPQTTEEKMGA